MHCYHKTNAEHLRYSSQKKNSPLQRNNNVAFMKTNAVCSENNMKQTKQFFNVKAGGIHNIHHATNITKLLIRLPISKPCTMIHTSKNSSHISTTYTITRVVGRGVGLRCGKMRGTRILRTA
jgi:hypothetical protein